METEKSGTPWAKFTVPSSGSTIQTRPRRSVSGAVSSATMPSPGNLRRSSARMKASLSPSASVTRSRGRPFVRTFSCPPTR
jgi:hypothetical protein